MAKVKIKGLSPTFILPTKATEGSSGYDFSYCGSKPVILYPINPLRDWVRKLFNLAPREHRATLSLGCKVELPKNHELQIRPRSGLAHKHGIAVVNSPATIDCDFRGEVKVILINLGSEPFVFTSGMRVCQGVFVKTDPVDLELVAEELAQTARAEQGFGSSGV